MALDAPSPEVFDTPAAVNSWCEHRRLHGARLVLVPTMGALHAGHLHLMDVARGLGTDVVVSIFVNPLQFNRADDFAKYPRPIDGDLAACARSGVAAVYAPTAGVMYPPGFQTHVEPGALADPLEGAGRPGHFRGVATVVCKLFGAVRPHVAVFGQKDYQQLAVVRQMVTDLDMQIDVVSVPTVREPDGLALSSRNTRLSPSDRAAAVCVPQALAAVAEALAAGTRDVAALEAVGTARIAAERRARLEYLAVVHPDTLQPLADVVDRAVVTTAVWFGDVRLIDNRLLAPQ